MESEPVKALNLDVNAQKNFIKFFMDLGEKPSTTVRFFNRNDYYAVHGENDANLVSKIIYKSSSQVKKMSPEPETGIEYLTLSKGKFEMAVRELLLVLHYRIEVYNRSPNSASNDWHVEYSGSPGNLIQFEDILFNDEIIVGTSIIALQLKTEMNEMTVGLVCVEQNDYMIQVTQFIDNEFFAELEATIVLLGPKECILPCEEGDYSKIKILLERNGVTATIRKKTEFNIPRNDVVQDLNKLLRFKIGQMENADSDAAINAMEIAINAVGALIKYLDMTNDAANLGNYNVEILNLERFVHLDSAAVSALNINPPIGTNSLTPGYHWQSILGVLDHCRTAQGHRLMAQWVKQPLRNSAILEDRHNMVECFLEASNTLSELHDDILKKLPDIQVLTKKLLRKKASLQDLFKIFQLIMRMPRLITTLKELENSSVKGCLYDPLKSTLADLIGLRQMIDQVLDFEGIKNGEYLIKSTFDDDLGEMKDKMDMLKDKMEKLLSVCSTDLDLEKSSVKLDHVSHLGYHFRIALKDDKVLRNSSKYKILDAIRGGVRFTSDKLQKYDEEFQHLKERYEELQQSIVDEVIRVALGYMVPLSVLNNNLATVDCIVSFAIAAKSAPITYVRPKMLPLGSGILELKNIRHPCLELQENVSYISNGVDFKKDETTMYIITGPNMGGKSTYIRSIGTAVLMAHVGAFVPCEKATISMVDSILGRVGANDNMMKGLSTFMVEMVETAGIIRTATENSLVIIDELGRGTSTYEGCGIAWSIAEHLASEKKCFTLFSTHFHEITELANSCPTVKNVHMAAVADNNDFLLLYQVRPGVMDKSFGIEVAKLADFPTETIKVAQEIYCGFSDFDAQNEHMELVKDKIIEIAEFIKENEMITDEELQEAIGNMRSGHKTIDKDYFMLAYPSNIRLN